MDVFARIVTGLATQGRLIGRRRGGLTAKVHVVADGIGRRIGMFRWAGQISDYADVRALLSKRRATPDPCTGFLLVPMFIFDAVRSPYTASMGICALTAASCFLRFGIS